MDTRNRKKISEKVKPQKKASVAAPSSPTTVLELDLKVAGRSYQGKFKYTVPTMGQRVDIGVLKAQYLDSMAGVDAHVERIADVLSYLRVTVEHSTAPQWWQDSLNGIDLRDVSVPMELCAKARAYEATFLGWGDDPKGDKGTPDDGQDSAADGDVVDDVQAAAQRPKVLATFGKGSRGAGSADAGDGGNEG